MRRKLSLLLALLMLIPYSGCASDPAEPDISDPASQNTDVQESEVIEEETVNLYEDLGEKDYNGYDFRILNTEGNIGYMLAEEQTGETVNDAIFEANGKVMDLANIQFSSVLVAEPAETFKQSVAAMDNGFDICMEHDTTSSKLHMAGDYMMNLKEFPHINWDAPWWPQFTMDALEFNNQIYMYSNYSTYLGNWFTRVIMCNLGQLRNMQLEDPYQLVYENKWTLDKLISMTADTYVDQDGNGQATYDDIYGFATTGTFYCWLEAWNMEVYRKDNEKMTIEVDVENEMFVNTIEKLYNWLHDSKGVFYSASDSGNWERDNYLGIFAAESSMFTYGVIGRLLQAVMDTEIEYAILPMPMADESVGKYYSATTDRPISVPVTCQDTDLVGYVIEAMAIAGYEMILPAYCDSALKGRYSVDQDSTAMIDIIFENRILGFSYLYSNGSFPLMLNELMSANSLNYASYVKSNLKVNQKWVQQVMAAYGIEN